MGETIGILLIIAVGCAVVDYAICKVAKEMMIKKRGCKNGESI